MIILILLDVQNLKKHFPVKSSFLSKRKGFVHAVDGVDFSINENETLGLVGESGCGKTTLGRVILRLISPTSGLVLFNGKNIFELDHQSMYKLRRYMQIIFQDPAASLNPRNTIFRILRRPYKLHTTYTKKEIEQNVMDLLETVGLSPASLFIDRFPHELSGGQKQRVVIARAVALHPDFVVADEPVSSLDVSIRAQILNLMKQLKKDLKLSCLFITHDLSVVRSICDKVAVMYLGKIVELADVHKLYDNPLHPYTKGLLAAIPIPDPKLTRSTRQTIIKGELPDPINPPVGCRFHPRCTYVTPICRTEQPRFVRVDNGHFVACHLY